MTNLKPFIKWVGGKRSILTNLKKHIPTGVTKYYEPFVGGGALYFCIQPDNAYLSDVNFRLITTYCAVRDEVDEVINNLRRCEAKHCKDYYLKSRKQFNENGLNNVEIAAS